MGTIGDPSFCQGPEFKGLPDGEVEEREGGSVSGSKFDVVPSFKDEHQVSQIVPHSIPVADVDKAAEEIIVSERSSEEHQPENEDEQSQDHSQMDDADQEETLGEEDVSDLISQEIESEALIISHCKTQEDLLSRVQRLRESTSQVRDFQLVQTLAGFDTDLGGKFYNVASVKNFQAKRHVNVQTSFSDAVAVMQGRRYAVIAQVDDTGQSKYIIISNTNPNALEYTLEYYDEESKTFRELTEEVYASFGIQANDRIVLSNRELPSTVETYHSKETPAGRVGGHYYHERRAESSGVYGLHAANAFFGFHAISFDHLSKEYGKHLEVLGHAERGEDSIVVPSFSDASLAEIREGNNPALLLQVMGNYCSGLEKDHPCACHRLAFNKVNIAASGKISLPRSLLDERVDRIVVCSDGKFFTFRKEVYRNNVTWTLIDSASGKQEEVNPMEYLMTHCSGKDIHLIYPEFEEAEATTVAVDLRKLENDPLSGKPFEGRSSTQAYDMERVDDFSQLLLSFSSDHSSTLLRRLDSCEAMSSAIVQYDDIMRINGEDILKELQGSCWGFGDIETLRQNVMSNSKAFRRLPPNIAHFLKVAFVGSRSWRVRHSEEANLMNAIGWDEDRQHRREVSRTAETFSQMLAVDKSTIEQEHMVGGNYLQAMEEDGINLPQFIISGKQLPSLLLRGGALQHLFDLFRIVHSGKKSQVKAFLRGISDPRLAQEMHHFVSRLLSESDGDFSTLRGWFPLTSFGVKGFFTRYKQENIARISRTQQLIESLPAGKTFKSRTEIFQYFYTRAKEQDFRTTDNPVVNESKAVLKIAKQYFLASDKKKFIASLPSRYVAIINKLHEVVASPGIIAFKTCGRKRCPRDPIKGQLLIIMECMEAVAYSEGDFTTPLGRLDWYSELVSKNNFLFQHAPETANWDTFIREDHTLFMLDRLVGSDHSIFQQGYKGVLDPVAFRVVFSKYKKELAKRSAFIEQQMNDSYTVPVAERQDAAQVSEICVRREDRCKRLINAYARHVLTDVANTSRARGMVAQHLSQMVPGNEEYTVQFDAAVDYMHTLSDIGSIGEDAPLIIRQAEQLVRAAMQPQGNQVEVRMSSEHRQTIAFLRQVLEKHKHYLGDLDFQSSISFLEMAVSELTTRDVMRSLDACDLDEIPMEELMELEKTIGEAFEFAESFSDYSFFKQIDMFRTRFRLTLQQRVYHVIRKQLMGKMDYLTRPGASAARKVAVSLGIGSGVSLNLGVDLTHVIARGDATEIDIRTEGSGGISLSLSGDLPGIAEASGKVYANALFKTGERFYSLEDLIDEIAQRSSCMAYSYMTLGLGAIDGVRAKRVLSRTQKELQRLERKVRTQHDLFAATVSEVHGTGHPVTVLPPRVERGRKMLLSSRGHVVGGEVSGSLLGDTLSASLAVNRSSLTTRVRKEIDFLTTLKRFPMLLDQHSDIVYVDPVREMTILSSVSPAGYRRERERLCLGCTIYAQKVQEYLQTGDAIAELEEKFDLLQEAYGIMEEDQLSDPEEPLDLTEVIDLYGGDSSPAGRAFILLQNELEALGIHGLTQKETLKIVRKLIRRHKEIFSRKTEHRKALISTLKSMEADRGIDRKALIRAYNKSQPREKRLAMQLASMGDEAMMLILNDYLRRTRESFDHLNRVAGNVIIGNPKSEIIIDFRAAEQDIPAVLGVQDLEHTIRELMKKREETPAVDKATPPPPEIQQLHDRIGLQKFLGTAQWREASKRLLRQHIEENFGRWQHYAFVVNQYEALPSHIEKLREELAGLKRQKSGLSTTDSRHSIVRDQISKAEQTISRLKERIPALREIKHKLEGSFSGSSGRVAMLKKTILSHLYMLRDYRMFCSSEEEFDDFVAELGPLEEEYTHPNVYLTGVQQRDLMVAGEFKGFAKSKELTGEVSVGGAKISLQAKQVEVSRDANIDNEGKYKNFSATIAVDPEFLSSIGDILSGVDSTVLQGLGGLPLDKAMKKLSQYVQGAVGGVLSAGVGAGVAVKLEWNLIESEGKYVVQYARATRAMEVSIGNKGSISGVSAEGKYAQGVSRYIGERTGDNTLTYLKTVYNGLREGYYERMRSKFRSSWQAFTQEHLNEMCSIFVNLATKPDSIVIKEWDADIESLGEALGYDFVSRFERCMRYIRDNNLKTENLRDMAHKEILVILMQSMDALLAANYEAIPVGISDTPSLPSLRDWVVDANSILS